MAYAREAFESAELLFDKLRPRLRSGHSPDVAIYRGQGNVNHPLIPTAMRDSLAAEPAEAIIFREATLLNSFVEACDRGGLAIPGDERLFRDNLAVIMGNFGSRDDAQVLHEWPLQDHNEIWAVAQHHGLRTRLLDWSRSPLVALYFAAQQCLFNEKNAPALAVWKLVRSSALEPGSTNRVRIVEVAAAHSPNLAAQLGLFTVTMTEDIQRGTQLDCTPIEELIDHNARGEPMLFRYELGREHAPDLLAICAAYGISGATMFPGFDGACRAAREMEILRHLRRHKS